MGLPLKEKKKVSKQKPGAKKGAFKGKLLGEQSQKLRVDQGESEMVVIGEIAKPGVGEEPNINERGESMGETRWDLFLAYFFAPIGSLVLWLMNKEDRTVFHCKQSAVLWVVAFVLSFFMIGILVWLYMLYVGWKAANGEDVAVPVVTDMLKK